MTTTKDSTVLKHIAWLGLATGLFATASLTIAHSLSNSVQKQSSYQAAVAQNSSHP